MLVSIFIIYDSYTTKIASMLYYIERIETRTHKSNKTLSKTQILTINK